jgi:hypothetical protein
LDLDGGMNSALTLKDKFTPLRHGVDVISCYDMNPSQSTEAWLTVKKHIADVKLQCKNGKYPYKVLIVDTFTQLVEAAITYMQFCGGRLNESRQIQDFNVAYDAVCILLAEMRSLPLTTVLLFHSVISEDSGPRLIQPAIPGQKLSPKILPQLGEVWYMRIKELGGGKQDRVVQTQGTSSIVCKTRLNIPEFSVHSTSFYDICVNNKLIT